MNTSLLSPLLMLGLCLVLLGITLILWQQNKEIKAKAADDKSRFKTSLYNEESKRYAQEQSNTAKRKELVSHMEQRISEINNACEQHINEINSACEQRINEINSACEAKIKGLQEAHALELRDERMRMISRKADLMSLSEKELVVETLYTLRVQYVEHIKEIECAINDLHNRMDTISGKLAFASTELATLTNRNRHRNESVCSFNHSLSQESFRAIVANVIRQHGFKRITDYYIEDAAINCIVRSITGGTSWTFMVDFNHNGEISGSYVCFADNEDSDLPHRFAETLKKELLYAMHSS